MSLQYHFHGRKRKRKSSWAKGKLMHKMIRQRQRQHKMKGKVKVVLLRSLELHHFPIKCFTFQSAEAECCQQQTPGGWGILETWRKHETLPKRMNTNVHSLHKFSNQTPILRICVDICSNAGSLSHIAADPFFFHSCWSLISLVEALNEEWVPHVLKVWLTFVYQYYIVSCS